MFPYSITSSGSVMTFHALPAIVTFPTFFHVSPATLARTKPHLPFAFSTSNPPHRYSTVFFPLAASVLH